MYLVFFVKSVIFFEPFYVEKDGICEYIINKVVICKKEH